LFSQLEDCWKIADFGISVPGTSKNALTTRYARGTDRYRAPELVTLFSAEKPGFTNKVDIWAFGCIIFELVCSKPAFPGGDSQVWVYAKHPTEYPLDLQIGAENVPDDEKREWFSTAIQELLQLEPARRPSTKDFGLRLIQDSPPSLLQVSEPLKGSTTGPEDRGSFLILDVSLIS
jgi:serine/threonine protein kinase